MLSNIFFLILTLLAIDFAPPGSFAPFSLIASLSTLSGVFLLMLFQKKWVRGKKRETLCLLELFATALIVFYGIGLPPFWGELVFLIFYFSALAVCHSRQIASFLLPFTFPFILLSLATLLIFPLLNENQFFIVSAALLILILLFFPVLLQFFWRSKALPESELKIRLECLCHKNKFRHGGLKMWTALKLSPTAAIVGILPRFRYVLFTDSLLRMLSHEEVEAVLAHEMGHAIHKHLLIYPLLLAALPLSGALLHPYLTPLPPLMQFAIYALMSVCYIFFVLGFFSRNFEKEADLHVFSAGLKGETLISSLTRLGQCNLLSLKKRNWHHGSLQERINFIKKAEEDPGLIRRHYLKMRFCLLCYVVGFVYGCFLL